MAHQGPAESAEASEKGDTELAPPGWRYTVRIDEALSTVETRLCSTWAIEPGLLIPGEPECAAFLRSATLAPGGGDPVEGEAGGEAGGGAGGAVDPVPLALDVGRRGVRVPAAPASSCLTVVVDVDAAARRTRTGRIAERVGRDLLTSPDLWLWHLAGDAQRGDVEVAFELPPGISVSTPWPRGEGDRYLVPPTVWRWVNHVAFGHFGLREIAVGDSRLEVAVLDGARTVSDDDVEAWLTRSARAVALGWGRFPRARAQVTVRPVGGGGGTVPFGKVVRGGGPGVHLLLGAHARWPEDFEDDWVSVHEMSHLYTPFLRDGGRWLSEGVATWYQTVLRARAGLLDEEEAWGKLLEGFERGRTNGRPGIPLTEAVDDMWTGGNFLRVYWSGTAWALLSDVALRQREPPSSLDDALGAFARCCLDSRRSWSALAFTDALDEQVGGHTFRETADAMLPGRRFPDVSGALAALGVSERWGRVELSDEPAAVALRQAILGRRPEAVARARAPTGSGHSGAPTASP